MVEKRDRVPPVWTANRFRPLKKGASRVRCGYDAGKKVTGRKRHLLVDTQGLLLEAVVHSAGIQDQDGARLVLGQGRHRQRGRYLRRLKLIWVDGKYSGKLVEWIQKAYGWTLEVVKRAKDAKGFVVLPRRWVIERTFGWLGRYRRLSRDYEGLLLTSEVLIYAAMVRLMLRRLTTNVVC